MKKFQKLSLFVLTAAVAASLAACSDKTETKKPEAGSSTTTEHKHDAGTSATTDAGKSTDSGTAATDGAVKEFTLEGKNFTFTPDKELKVKKGDKVKITLKNVEGMHGIEIADFNVKTTGDGVVEFVADKAGTFTIQCSVMCGSGHMDMKTTLTVE